VERDGTNISTLAPISLVPSHGIPVLGKVPVTGFPSTLRRADIGVRRVPNATGEKSAENPTLRLESDHGDIKNSIERDNFRSQNRAAVLAMRPEEVALAMQELGMHLSPESLAFLGRRGEKELQMELEGTAKPIESILEIQGGIQEESKISMKRVSPLPDSRLTSSTATVAARGPPADPSDMLPTIEGALEAARCSTLEEFDIDGKKLVVRSDFISQFTDIVCSDALYAEQFIHSNPLLLQSIKDIACNIFDTCQLIGFCVESIAVATKVSSGIDVQFGDLSFDDLESGAERASFSLSKACAVSFKTYVVLCMAMTNIC
jgi:hypothetical protein